MLKLNPKGRDGISLEQKWESRFETYLGTTVAGFPNLFMIHGPTSPGVLYTMPLGGERTTQWIAGCIEHMQRNGLGVIDATDQAMEAWDNEVNALANQTLYPRTNSWYVGANIPGKPRQFLAHIRGSRFFDRLAEIAQHDYEGFVFEGRR